MSKVHSDHINFIWTIANLLRGPYGPPQYRKVMLPLTVLRRLDCVLKPTKEKVIEKCKSLKKKKIKNIDPILKKVAGQEFYNTSPLTFEKMVGAHENIAQDLKNYIKSFSENARNIIERFGFEEHIDKLDETNRLYKIMLEFSNIDLSPERVTNIDMGYIFEELVRKFNEQANEEAGDHFTPREVIRLMTHILYTPDDEVFNNSGLVVKVYDPACGTGGMLSVSDDYIREHSERINLELFGQEYNDESWAICCSDMLIKGKNPEQVLNQYYVVILHNMGVYKHIIKIIC
ncbi:MAG: DNA methylase [Candidatus Scalindua rubra]|uniref:site-specific DNA-methyltransferase (adenine-specific) n=1 Tax=Candidatus Scalindua rubra TaxID=1872076 RepID=A0A1E3X4B0_9BACT|nr:MAG: DNA methylase [Candidatus Scalindua rubra]